jgi:ABC-type enterochelin transport system permease subunit
MDWLIAAILCAVVVEFAARLPLGDALRSIASAGNRAFEVITSRSISDHWKEKVLLVYSGRMMRASFVLIGVLGFLFATVSAAILAAKMFGFDLLTLLTSWQGATFSVVAATVYAKTRFRNAG